MACSKVANPRGGSRTKMSGLTIVTNLPESDGAKANGELSTGVSARSKNSAKLLEAMASNNWRKPRTSSVDSADGFKTPKIKVPGSISEDNNNTTIVNRHGRHQRERKCSSSWSMKDRERSDSTGDENQPPNENGGFYQVRHYSTIKQENASEGESSDYAGHCDDPSQYQSYHIFKLTPTQCAVNLDQGCSCDIFPTAEIARADAAVRYVRMLDDSSLECQLQSVLDQLEPTPPRSSTLPALPPRVAGYMGKPGDMLNGNPYEYGLSDGSPESKRERCTSRFIRELRSQKSVLEDPAVKSIRGYDMEAKIPPSAAGAVENEGFEKLLSKLRSSAIRRATHHGDGGDEILNRRQKGDSQDSAIDVDNSEKRVMADPNREKSVGSLNPRAREFFSVDSIPAMGHAADGQGANNSAGCQSGIAGIAAVNVPFQGFTPMGPFGAMPLPTEHYGFPGGMVPGSGMPMNMPMSHPMAPPYGAPVANIGGYHVPGGMPPHGMVVPPGMCFTSNSYNAMHTGSIAPPQDLGFGTNSFQGVRSGAAQMSHAFFGPASMQNPASRLGPIPGMRPIPRPIAGPSLANGPGLMFNADANRAMAPATTAAPFRPTPIRKPRGHDPAEQQRYEEWIEWRKQTDPNYAVQCKAQQAKRAERNQQTAAVAPSSGPGGEYANYGGHELAAPEATKTTAAFTVKTPVDPEQARIAQQFKQCVAASIKGAATVGPLETAPQ